MGMAYSNSVLRVENLKFSDYQITAQGILLAGCFFFISRSLPCDKLASLRPLPNVFNTYTLCTVMGQFFNHLFCLTKSIQMARETEVRQDEDLDKESDFSPSLVNSLVFIIGTTLQICTFAVNYRGEPFMVPLQKNKPLLYSIGITMTLMVIMAGGFSDELASTFRLVPFHDRMHNRLLGLIFLDFVGSFVIDRTFRKICGKAKIKPLR